MRAMKLGLLAKASGLALWAGPAAAAVFTLNLTGATPTFSTDDSGGVTTVRYDFDLSGFDPQALPSVQVGDEVIINLTFSDGAITLPATSYIDVTSFYLTGDGFPAGDSATHGTTTLFSGGLGGSVVATDSEGSTTTSDGVASNQVFGAGVLAMTFDAVSTDFVIDQIAGSSDPGTLGTLDRAHFSADSRSIDPVPEPAAWALMLAGFGGLGATLRVRRKALLA